MVTKNKILSGLAPLFNALLGIEPDYFGYTPRTYEPGAGEKRAMKREAEQRAAQKERLKNAALPRMTRQQARRQMLLMRKAAFSLAKRKAR